MAIEADHGRSEQLASQRYGHLINIAAVTWMSELQVPSHPKAQKLAFNGIQSVLSAQIDRIKPENYYGHFPPIEFGIGTDPLTDLATRATIDALQGLGLRRRKAAEIIHPPQHTHIEINPEKNTVILKKQIITKSEDGRTATKLQSITLYPFQVVGQTPNQGS